MEKLLVIQVAALGHGLLVDQSGGESICDLDFKPVASVFPAVTCAVQASFKTGTAPSAHGMVGNGFYSREFSRPFFWEQSAALVSGRRIWESFRGGGGTVGVLFWQQSLGTHADVLLSPAPIHKHHGGMIQDCFSRPEGLYGQLKREMGRGFNLMHYWGPWTSLRSTTWIAGATERVMGRQAPDLLLTYLPHLDYELQKSGPESPAAAVAFGEVRGAIEGLVATARSAGYKVLIFGDYAIAPVSRPVHPNRALCQSGLMSTRRIGNMLYPDLHTSRAFCVVDHQVGHVILKDPGDAGAVRSVLEAIPGVASILDGGAKAEAGIDHSRAGDLVLVAEGDSWFAYPWWSERSQAPDYATHVDIHNKPGYDPCELFRSWWPFATSTDATRILGSHGLVGAGLEATWASDLKLDLEPGTLVDLARGLGEHLDRKAQS